MTVLPSAGGMQETFCLRLDLLHGWLFTIDESRVKDEEIRQRVLDYKRDCYRVLFKHFYGRGMEDRPEPLKVVATEDARKENIRTRRQLVSEARQTHGTHAARQLWAYLGLPMTPAMTETPHQMRLFAYTAIKAEEPDDKSKAA